jgi:hypothetical protein
MLMSLKFRLQFLSLTLLAMTSFVLGVLALQDSVYPDLPDPYIRSFSMASPAVDPPEAEGVHQPTNVISPTLTAAWQAVAPGVDYQFFSLADPNRVYVARMDRSVADLMIESGIAAGQLVGGLETVRGMADRYDQALSYWGQAWGGRNQVIVAINGDFYDPETALPQRGIIHSGWYSYRFPDYENGSGFAWKLDRSAFIGECVFNDPSKQLLTFLDSGTSIKIHGVNVSRPNNQMVLYTPQFNERTPDHTDGVEVVLRMLRPSLVLPTPAMALGEVVAVRDFSGQTPIAFDHVVLSAEGIMRTKLLENIKIGDDVGISQSLVHYAASDCSTPASQDWVKTYASVGGSYVFLKAGQVQSFSDDGATVRAPRTAVAFDDDYLYFIVVDGRSPGISAGMTIGELALFVQGALGAQWAIAQDGGGSSTLVINGEVMNTPSDTTEVPCENQVFLPIARLPGKGRGTADPVEPAGLPTCQVNVERAVANSLMMVRIEPKVISTQYSEGQAIQTVVPAALRAGPGTNYGILKNVPAGSAGTILVHANHLNGVQATGSSWWWVQIDGEAGWISETALAVP